MNTDTTEHQHINDGGPAFPAPDLGEQHFGQRGMYAGMTLRDWFAGKAMEALIVACGDSDGAVSYDEDAVAESAYRMADAMLKARQS